MQLFSADATIFFFLIKKKNAREYIKKMSSKVAYFTAQSKIFSTANRPKTNIPVV